MEKTKIMIVDDHTMLREGLKKLIEMEDDLEVIAMAGNGQEAIDNAIRYMPDIIFMDISMPGINGIEAAKTIKKEVPCSKIIFLTIHDDRAYMNEAMKLKPGGYILKDADSSILIDAIRTVHEGGTYTYPDVYDICTCNDDVCELSTREVEVLNLLTQGLTNKEIAQKLLISEKTVKNHLYSIFKKLGVQDRTQAVLYAIKNNLS
ncbi:response regulator [Calorimonas adulescens]|uniref:Stage 0 sporulation protein A homolog n=1 Tax=Calorimonas adulescens TaxID=2606906 RepID=A0A5D8QCK1_9THEO|nr:response regulator transcription factor [Calorimonas adulescens]TZE82271.1 response regulator transcription factor [Calorimonas adulescens]